MNKRTPLEFNAHVQAEREKSLLLRINGQYHWIPKSQVVEYPNVDHTGRTLLTPWICTQKGLA